MHRFFVAPAQIVASNVRFDSDQAHQLRRVLRLRPGDRVLVLDGQEWQYEVVLVEVTNARVSGRVETRVAAAGEPAARLTLFQSFLRREKFEWVLQKGTEIGVAEFVPVVTRRSLVRDIGDVTPEKSVRWQRIIREAAEQSGRGLLPRLHPPIPFGAAASEAATQDRALIAWEREPRTTLREALGMDTTIRQVALYVGPEGGFEPVEVEEAIAYGALPVTFGPRIMRTETAAVVGAALILHELGELG